MFANLLSGWECSYREFLVDDTFYLTHLSLLAHIDYGDRDTCLSCTSCTSASVCIAFCIVRQGIVDNVSKIVHVKSACCHVSSYKKLQMTLAEFLHHEVTLGLTQFAVKRVGTVSVLYQLVGYLLSLYSCTAEDDTVYLRIVVHDTFQREILVLCVYDICYMVYVLAAFVLCSYGYFFCVMQVSLRNARDFRTHCGREHQSVTVFRHFFQYGIDTFGESHVEHLVGFVHHYVSDSFKAGHFALHKVDESSRSSYYDMHTFF